MQHSAVITRPAAADTVRRRCLAVLVMSRCLTFRLGDHAEKSPPPPHHHSCLSKQTIPASCTKCLISHCISSVQI